ncbi:MAG: hypothetical protein MK554_08410 [Planctomycetes bacterium]|nr:hypothetical protein [Planctomycetota bacterium]
MGLSDELLIAELLDVLGKNGHRFSEAVLTLVKSRQFLYHRGRDHVEENR